MTNFWAIFVCAILHMAVGAYWYSSALFGKKWMAYAEISKEKMNKINKNNLILLFVFMFVGALIMAYTLNYFLFVAGALRATEAFTVVFAVWLGFVAVSHLGSVLFERRPVGYYWINTLYYLIVLLIDGLILTAWR